MFFHRETHGIRVTAQPYFLPDRSDPDEDRWVFGYRVRIENVGRDAAQLVWRHWYIHDPAAGDSEVEGEGVIGEQPLIGPGGVHEYQSFCILEGPEGSMEGFFEFVRPDGSRFNARIPHFFLRTYRA
jgi:ApaG protein